MYIILLGCQQTSSAAPAVMATTPRIPTSSSSVSPPSTPEPDGKPSENL